MSEEKKEKNPIELKEKMDEKEKESKKDHVEESKPKEKKEEKRKEEKIGIAYILSSFNNTIVHITDLSGNTISRATGGMVTKHDRLKANPTIAMFIAKRAAERAKDLGITGLYVRMRAKTGSRGLGPGAHAVVRSLGKEGFRILNILETTKYPRGGPRKKGGRRGRRV
jgi:small subunit ribosomal protein S11